MPSGLGPPEALFLGFQTAAIPVSHSVFLLSTLAFSSSSLEDTSPTGIELTLKT